MPSPNFFVLFRKWKADLTSRLGPSTIKQYTRYVIAVGCEIGKDLTELTCQDVKKHLGTLRPQYAEITRAALVDFYDFCVRRGYLSTNPAKPVSVRVRGRKRLKRGLTEEELIRLLIAAVWTRGEKLGWMILAQYALGLRPLELMTLTPEKIHLNGNSSCVYLTDTKTGNDGVVPVGSLAKEALRELVKDCEGSITGIGRTRYWELVRGCARLAGLPDEKCRPYALRHSFGNHLAERGIHVRVIMDLLRHTDLRATVVYTVPSDDALRKAVEVLG